MKHTLAEIDGWVSAAGVRDPDGFPLRATLAAIGQAEGADPNAWVAHDPPKSATAPPSSGLFQVHRGAWPEIYEQTERVRLAAIPDRDKGIAMAELVKPILADAFRHAALATRILGDRGIRVTPLETALFIDATWQAGGPHLLAWAQRTRTGDPREIVNPSRTVDVEVALRKLAGEELGLAPGIGLVLGVLAAFGLAAVVLSQWET